MSDQIRQGVVDAAVKAIVRQSVVIADSLGLDWTSAELKAIYEAVVSFSEHDTRGGYLSLEEIIAQCCHGLMPKRYSIPKQ